MAVLGSLRFWFSPDGRISRFHYWAGTFVLLIVTIPLLIPTELFVSAQSDTIDQAELILSIIMIWPGIALTTKRCHDRNRSGWFQLVVLVPILGALWLLIDLGALEGTKGTNRFGPDPIPGRGVLDV